MRTFARATKNRISTRFLGSRGLHSVRALHKFFGSRRLRASPQGYSPWTSRAAVLQHPPSYLRWRGSDVPPGRTKNDVGGVPEG
jgi:hypothetical protein